MKEEFIDILTKKGGFTGQVDSKNNVHKKGYYHNTAHVWLFTKNGKILLQQRSKNKTIYPLLWDVSVAGHIDAGETVIEGALREMKEEIGLVLTMHDLKKLNVFECFRTYDQSIIDNEFRHTFIAQLKIPLGELTPQKEEVEALKLVDVDEFLKLLNTEGNNHFVKTYKDYYLQVIEVIKHNI